MAFNEVYFLRHASQSHNEAHGGLDRLNRSLLLAPSGDLRSCAPEASTMLSCRFRQGIEHDLFGRAGWSVLFGPFGGRFGEILVVVLVVILATRSWLRVRMDAGCSRGCW